MRLVHFQPVFIYLLEGENRVTLRSPDVNDVIFEKIIQVLV